MNFPVSDSMISCKICQQYSLPTSALKIPESTTNDLLVVLNYELIKSLILQLNFCTNVPQKASALGQDTCDFTLLAIHWCYF